MNMYKLLEKAAQTWPEDVFIVREGIKYPDFAKMVKARATTLRDLGVEKGAVVGILSRNIMEFPLTMFAVWYLGGRVLLLDTNLTPFEYDNMTRLTDCRLVIAEKSFFYKAADFKFQDIQAKDDEADPDLKPASVESLDIATLSFTSGSTGNPKIVPLSHFNITECAASLSDMQEFITNGDIMYGFLPLYHIFGFAIGICAPLNFGAGILLQPTVDPKAILADFKDFRPHIIPAVPRVFELFRAKIIDGMKQRKVWDIARVVLKYNKVLRAGGLGWLVDRIQKPVLEVFGGRARLLIAGGAATKPEVETFYNNLGLVFIQGYGLTETVGPICISYPCEARMPFSIGRAVTNNEFEIREKNADGVGVLWLRGHQVFGGYLDNPTANAEVFDDRGFFNTGDLVSIDTNGELHFHGRKKQIIVLDSGKNVYPDELEGLFIEIPGVKNVAVFEHGVKGKTVAYGVFQVEDGMTMKELAAGVAAANKKVASYKWVTHFAITTDELPLTSTKKVKHHIVREKLMAGEYPVRKE
ncbi:MAG: AMP-binding protein [Alphaproteobacteria bacterium]|nr:AMP-binding protein [Alphaproteobacteria bacterium]